MIFATSFDSTPLPINPFSAGASALPLNCHLNWLEGLIFSGVLMVALIFVGYLLRCYLQEFRRRRRVQRRKDLSRASSGPGKFEPMWSAADLRPQLTEGPEQESLMVKGLDCWCLQWVIPSHEQITMVWEKPGAIEGPEVLAHPSSAVPLRRTRGHKG